MRTCLSDAVAPKVWKATRRALERAGVDVKVPRGQTCCGQPAWTAGHPDQARAVARHTIKVFAGSDEVVVPSGSCAGMVIHAYPELFAGQPDEEDALDLALRTIEFTQFIAKHDLDPRAKACGALTVHDSCHMLRVLDENESPRDALAKVPGCEVGWASRRRRPPQPRARLRWCRAISGASCTSPGAHTARGSPSAPVISPRSWAREHPSPAP